MEIEIGDRVTHKDYPKIKGQVFDVNARRGYLLVLWDSPRPSDFGGNVRTSRHIPSALKLVD